MADRSLSIRLALTDGGKVKAELADIGASGQKALERIRDAAQPASRGLQALDAASHAVRGKIQEMAGSTGILGEALQRVGPYGLAAAAGVGVVTAALGLAIGRAREAIETFDALDDQAARIGASAESFQELVYAFGQIGVKADATETALTRLNDVVGDVMIQGAKTPAEVARAFDQLGVSMADVQKHGQDLDWMLAAMAEGMKTLGTQAERTSVAKALMGKQAAALLPLLAEGAAGLDAERQAAHAAGAVLGENLVEQLSTAGDRLAAFDRALTVQSARSFAVFSDAIVETKGFVVELWTGINDLLDVVRQQVGDNVFKEIAEWAFSPLKPIQSVIDSLRSVVGLFRDAREGGEHGATGSWGDEVLPAPKARPVDVPHGSGRGGWPQLKEESGGGKQSAAEKQAEQVAELIAKAHLEADAEERLAKAAGMSSAALRQAANDNKVAAFAHEHGAAAAARYRVEIERASDAEQRRQLVTTIRGLEDQADAAERLAAAQADGTAAAHRVTLENQAFAEALKVGAAGSDVFTAAYGAVLEQLQRKDAADTRAKFLEELQTRQDALRVDQLDLSLMDQSGDKRAELVASLQEELRLRQQLPVLTQQQIDQLMQLSAADAKVKAQIKEREEAERDFALIARQGLSDVVAGLKDVVTGARTWQEALLGVAQSLGRIAEQQLVDKPLSKLLDQAFSGGGSGGMLGQIGSWFGSLFGAGATGTSTGVSAGTAHTATMGGFEMSGSSLFLAARGGIFEGGNVIPFARGGVFDRPTLFPMARGMGLMGEAGPEAVLPLRRLPSGRLGVETPGSPPGTSSRGPGGGGHSVSVNVVVNGGDPATADRFRRTAAQAARDALLAAEEHKRRFG